MPSPTLLSVRKMQATDGSTDILQFVDQSETVLGGVSVAGVPFGALATGPTGATGATGAHRSHGSSHCFLLRSCFSHCCRCYWHCRL